MIYYDFDPNGLLALVWPFVVIFIVVRVLF